jgi:dTDP-4-amino-4,6-dideoxygalactose transaminase
VFLSEPTVGEPEAERAAGAIRARKITAGPALADFERGFADFLGVGEAVAVSSGTAALHLALLDAGVGPGDEVWVSDLTFIASANAAAYCGARVTLVDSERETWNLDPQVVVDELEQRAAQGAPMPAAIVAVHLLGHPADLAPIADAATRHGVALVEDAAEALGSSWTDGPLAGMVPGTVAPVGIYSFNGNKIMTTGGGGMLVARDGDRLARLRHLAQQAKIPGSDYEHDAVGFNYRLSHVNAAIGSAQLERLPQMIDRRREIAVRYEHAFADLDGVGKQPDAPWAHRSGWLSTIVLADFDTRRRVREALDAAGLESRPVWQPLRTQKPYADAPVLGGDVAVDLGRRILCLPCSAHLTESEQDDVIATVRSALQA